MTENGNAASWFVDRHIEEGRADNIAFYQAGSAESLSYGALAEQSAQMAGLCQRHGLTRESRAVMLVLDELAFPVIFWGALKAGVIPVPVNTLLSAEVVGAIIRDSRAASLFVSAPLLALAEAAVKDMDTPPKLFVIGAEAAGPHLNFTEELAASPALPTLEVSPDETAFWLYSSGSTGQPKGIMHVHGNLKQTQDTYGQSVLSISETDVIYSVAKLFFAYGLGNGMTFPMAAGASVWLYDGRPTPETVSAVIKQARPTLFFGVPTLYAALLAAQQGSPIDGADQLRLCLSAGEALPPQIGKQWNALTGVDIMDGIGSTEMLHIYVSNKPDDFIYGTTGLPVPGYEVRLVDEADQDVADGEIGELLVKGASAANGYWNQRQKSRSTFIGEWTRTGDKFIRDTDGRLTIAGRTDDMFKVSGIWVSPFEVEKALIEHPAVLEAAVVARADAEGLDKPEAHIVLQPGQSGSEALAEELKDHVKTLIGKWKYPRWIVFADDLPKTATGKIQRFALRR